MVGETEPISQSTTTATSVTTSSSVTTDSANAPTNIISGRPIANNAHSPLSTLESWTDEEVAGLRKALKVHGTRWSDIAQMIGTAKTPHQCMNFYYTYNKKLGLDQIIQKIKVMVFKLEQYFISSLFIYLF